MSLEIADEFGRGAPPEPPAWYGEPEHDVDEVALDEIRRNERISKKVQELRELEEARRRFAREQRADKPRPRFVQLDEFLDQPDSDPTYRIDQVWPTGGRVMFEARKKAGKTTAVGNSIRSLVDGDPFLGRFHVAQVQQLALIDNELDPRTMRRWLRSQGVINTDRVKLVNLRGAVDTFDLLNPEIRAEWAKDLAGSDIVLLDCLRPVLDALGLDENRDAGRFLVAFDALLLEAGVSEAMVVHHMGHGAERSRGDSRLGDWPDAIWRLVLDQDDKEQDDPEGPRFFSAFGRDVLLPQGQLAYDPTTRRLHLSEHAPTRAQATEQRKVSKSEDAIVEVLTATPGLGKTELRQAVNGRGIRHNPHIDAALANMIRLGIVRADREGRKHRHYLIDPQETLE